jgi:hypothetical protein
MRNKKRNTPSGLPRLAQSKRGQKSLPVYDSMQSCEGATGIPRAILQQAKREGCDAFDSHSRVDLAKLLRYWFARGEGNVDWALRQKRADALKAERELAKMEGALVSIDEVYRQQAQAVAKARAVLTQKFEGELPAKQNGMPAEKIAETNREALEQVFAVLGKRETYC